MFSNTAAEHANLLLLPCIFFLLVITRMKTHFAASFLQQPQQYHQHVNYKDKKCLCGLKMSCIYLDVGLFLPGALLPLHFPNFTRRIQLTRLLELFFFPNALNKLSCRFFTQTSAVSLSLINLGLTTAESNNCFLVFLLQYAMGFIFYKQITLTTVMRSALLMLVFTWCCVWGCEVALLWFINVQKQAAPMSKYVWMCIIHVT